MPVMRFFSTSMFFYSNPASKPEKNAEFYQQPLLLQVYMKLYLPEAPELVLRCFLVVFWLALGCCAVLVGWP